MNCYRIDRTFSVSLLQPLSPGTVHLRLETAHSFLYRCHVHVRRIQKFSKPELRRLHLRCRSQICGINVSFVLMNSEQCKRTSVCTTDERVDITVKQTQSRLLNRWITKSSSTLLFRGTMNYLSKGGNFSAERMIGFHRYPCLRLDEFCGHLKPWTNATAHSVVHS